DQAFFDLFNGANVGDALLRSERLLKWKIINIGDPLYRPFPNSPTMAARVMPAVMLALLPQTTLGDSSSEGGVAVSRPSSQDVNFSVISDHRDLVTVPPTVTITPGSAGVKFPINTHHVST